MEFIIILASAVLLRNSDILGAIQRDDWFQSWRETVWEFSLPERAQLWLSVLLPVLVVFFVCRIFDGFILGLIGFAITIFLVLYSLGRFEFDKVRDRYFDSMQSGDTQAALNSLSEAGYAEPADDIVDLHYNFEYEFVYNEFQRWFAVVFMFLLLGPVAAFLYRLLTFVSRESEEVSFVVSILEWVPVRLLGFTWALVGNFDDLSIKWEDSLEHGLDSGASLSVFTSTELAPDLSPGDIVERGQHLKSMFRRSMVLWVVVAALIVLFV